MRPIADRPPSPPVTTPVPGPLKPGDAKLLKDLEMLLDLELLEGWDPDEDLPIPVTPDRSTRSTKSGEPR